MKNLYINKTPLRLLFIFKVLIGSLILYIFIDLFLIGIYLEIWTIAGPLLGLGLVINGLIGKKIKEINLKGPEKILETERLNLFGSRIRKVDIHKKTAELKTGNNKKKSIITKLRLVISESNEEIEEIKSNFLSINNKKLRMLYSDLKDISKITNANKMYKT